MTINELVIGVNIALDKDPLTRCTRIDTDGDGMVKVDEFVSAVLNALNGGGEPIKWAVTGRRSKGYRKCDIARW